MDKIIEAPDRSNKPKGSCTNCQRRGGDCITCAERTFHMSDCSVHNEPAYPAGPCDCGLQSS